MSSAVFHIGFVILFIFKSSFGLIPKICVHNVSTIDKICCPIPDGYSVPCGGPGRGTCSKLYVHWERVESVFRNDDRLNWPTRFFKSMCICEGTFYGTACETCWYGWKGKYCDEKEVKLRPNIFSLSDFERKTYLNILDYSNNMPSEFMILKESDTFHSDPLHKPTFIDATFQEYIAFVHRYASRATLFSNKLMCSKFGYFDYNHNTVSFATWHRALMLYWERELSKIALKKFNIKNFGIPYWDWIDAKTCEVCNNRYVGATGKFDPYEGIWLIDEGSQFHNWTEYCSPPVGNAKCVGCHFRKKFPPLNRKYIANDFPTTEDLIFVLRHSSFYLADEKLNQTENCRSYHVALEGFCGRPNDDSSHLFMHNKVHNMVQGSMCCASTASNDPLFILHHSNIDKILQCWFEIFSPLINQLPNHGAEPGNCRECNIVGYLPPVKHAQMFTKMENLGVKYDNDRFGKKGFSCSRMAEFIRKNKF